MMRAGLMLRHRVTALRDGIGKHTAIVASGFAFAVLLATAGRAAPPQPEPVVINVQTISAEHAASILRRIYPRDRVSVDRQANAVIVVGPARDIAGMRQIITGIDIKNPTDQTIDTVQLHTVRPADAISRIAPLFPHARFREAPNRDVLIAATPQDMTTIKALLATLDAPVPTPSPRPRYPAEAVTVTQNNVRDVARAVAKSVPNVRVAVSGSSLLLAGSPDDVGHAKALIAQLDHPQAGVQYTEVYRLRFVDATSVANLLRSSFRNTSIQVDKDLNALTVLGTTSVQRRIADAVSQLDVGPAAGAGEPGANPAGGGGASLTQVLNLRAAVPGLNGAPSTSANDIATTVQSALSGSAPDLKVTVPPNSTQLVLSGSSYSIKLARDLIDQLDTTPLIVALDTEVLEVDEGVSKQLGLKFPTAALGTTFSELAPAPPTDGSAPGPLMRLQRLTRTPLSLQAQIDFLITNHKARILEDPRLTTISGRTASLRAGETINILTTTGGGTGTVATTQVQSFQTGVTLDITPVVNANNYITVSLHPSVNTFAGNNNGVPQIQTRDATTTVGLQDGQTLVIGGLIEDDVTHDAQKIPFLGDLPLIGKVFRDTSVQYSRNELIVTVTPHVVQPGENANITNGPALPTIPTPAPLPTLSPGTKLPPARKDQPPPSPAPEPSPIEVGTPPPNLQTAAPRASASPHPAPSTRASTPPNASPQPLPTAFAQTNAFTYGQAPQNNYADPQAPPQIFYVQAQPTVLRNGQPLTISAITTTNVTRLTFGSTTMNAQVSLSKIGPGQWQSTFGFSTAGLPTSQGNVQMSLTAYTNLGALATVQIPISLVSP